MRRRISSNNKPVVKSPVDAIGYYPVRNRAVIYLMLEYVNHALGSVMPYVGVVAYEEAFGQMVGLLVSDAADVALDVPLRQLSDELAALWQMFEETAAEWERGITPSAGDLQENGEQLIGACALAVALGEILSSFHALPPDEINGLLDDRYDHEGLPCFRAIERMGNRIAHVVMDRIMSLSEMD